MTTQTMPLNERSDALLDFGNKQNIPLILQTQASECGLACLAMVASYYGLETDLVSMRRKYPESCHEATLKQIMAIAARMNLASRAVRLDLEQLKQLQLPCILHWKMSHFVVLKEVRGNKMVILDPARGERHLDIAEISDFFTGVALELTPSAEFTPGVEHSRLRLHHFWSSISGLKRSLGLVLALSLLIQLFAIVSPYYMQSFIDNVLISDDYKMLNVLALGFGLLLLIEVGAYLLRQQFVLNISTRLNMQMSANLFQHLLQLPMDYFISRHGADIVSRFSSLNIIRAWVAGGSVSVLLDGILALVTLMVMFLYNTTLTLAVLLVAMIYALMRLFSYRSFRQLSEEHLVGSENANAHLMTSVNAIQTVKLYGKESEMQNQWHNYLADSTNKEIQIGKWQVSFDASTKLLFGSGYILVIYLASGAVMSDAITLGMLFAFLSYKQRFIEALDKLMTKLVEFKMLDLHFQRLADIVLTQKEPVFGQSSECTGSRRQSSNHSIRGAITVDRLSYRYNESEPPVLRNINMHINAGETVVIVGASGSGKSTLLHCLMGLIKPTKGDIAIDLLPLSDLANYRQQISGVLQDDQLISGTIAQNIACFEATIDLEKVTICAQLACIHSEILQMNMQYNTLIKDSGSEISRGQKQRILLARAFYRQPKILFIDEATCHLDIGNEAKINAHIKQLNMTRVIVAHQTETIKMADRVYALNQGELIELPKE